MNIQRQVCRKCLGSCEPSVTLTFDSGTRRLHWCAECTDGSSEYYDQSDQNIQPVRVTDEAHIEIQMWSKASETWVRLAEFPIHEKTIADLTFNAYVDAEPTVMFRSIKCAVTVLRQI